MADLKDLQEMAKNGEVSKKLLEDEAFKKEIKIILKKESKVEVTDEQIIEIIKSFETALQNEGLLKEAELREISGGKIGENIKSKLVKGGSAVVGALLGTVLDTALMDRRGSITNKINGAWTRANMGLWDLGDAAFDEGYAAKAFAYRAAERLSDTGASIFKHKGTLGGAYGGYKLGEYICKKFDIK